MYSTTRAAPAALLAVSLLGLPACGGGGSEKGSDAGPTADTSGPADTPSGDTREDLKVSSVQPPKGPIEGGTMVAVSGTGLTDADTVLIGGHDAKSFEVVSDFKIEATTPAATDGAGKVDVVVELPDGSSDTLTDGFEYTDSQTGDAIGWCNLKHPPTMTVEKDKQTSPVFGRVYVEGCTDGSQKCEEVTAELGWGHPAKNPAKNPGDYSWTSASYNDGHTADDNDEYKATWTPTTAGTFTYTYRFSIDDGQNWTYCDLDDNSNGFQTDQMGQIIVNKPQMNDPTVDWCNTQHPEMVTVETGKTTPEIFGRVFSEKCTEETDQCPAIEGEFGWGDPTKDPSANPSAYNWTSATYNPRHMSGDNNDEYKATVTPMNEGSYAYLYRFSDDGGNSWTYCDLNGLDKGGFTTDQMGTLEVEKPQQTVTIDWCNLQHPTSITVSKGSQTPVVYGRVHSPNCTKDKSASTRTECTEITGEVGWGPQDVDPSKKPSKYNWKQASYNAGFPSPPQSSDNDEHSVRFTPTSTGSFDYVFRFSGDGGQSWTYCDKHGGKFDPFNEGSLTVN